VIVAAKPEYRELPLGVIDEPVLPSRTTMDEEKMHALVTSMRELGFISVLVVARVGERYEVVAGHRRRIAAGRAGLVAVPCLVYASKGAAMEAIQHAENKHREELNAADEAIWFAQLMEAHPGRGHGRRGRARRRVPRLRRGDARAAAG
jgi:ParB family chromosome partitioning protein